MNYTLKLFTADDATPEQRRAAEQLFRHTLEEALGDASLVAPVYSAYLQIVARHGEIPDEEALTSAELSVLAQWQAAIHDAVVAVFGPMRQMGDADYEIALSA